MFYINRKFELFKSIMRKKLAYETEIIKRSIYKSPAFY